MSDEHGSNNPKRNPHTAQSWDAMSEQDVDVALDRAALLASQISDELVPVADAALSKATVNRANQGEEGIDVENQLNDVQRLMEAATSDVGVSAGVGSTSSGLSGPPDFMAKVATLPRRTPPDAPEDTSPSESPPVGRPAPAYEVPAFLDDFTKSVAPAEIDAAPRGAFQASSSAATAESSPRSAHRAAVAPAGQAENQGPVDAVRPKNGGLPNAVFSCGAYLLELLDKPFRGVGPTARRWLGWVAIGTLFAFALVVLRSFLR